MRHPLRGLLVGPLAAPLAYWAGSLTYALWSGFHVNALQALRELGVLLMFGLPIAYAATLIWGAPVLYGLRRLGWRNAATLIAAGALGGALAAFAIELHQGGSFFRVYMPLWVGAVLGALTAAVCWWAGAGKTST